MNTFKLYSYRIPWLLFLLGLLLLALADRQGWQPLTALRNVTSGALTKAAPLEADANPPALLLLQADALVLPMTNGTAQISARVRDARGNPVAGSTVKFQGALGMVNPTSVTTDANGVARATFQAAGHAGRALVTATVNQLSREAAVQLVNPATAATNNGLTLDFAASKVDPGQTVSVHAVLRDAAGQPVAGELITLFGSLGEVTPASVLSDANGNVSAAYHAGQSVGRAMITALAGVASKSVNFQVGDLSNPEQPALKTFFPIISR
ncbi:MAG: Ig-like domain-containing protein [Caldilineaceae bacterium]